MVRRRLAAAGAAMVALLVAGAGVARAEPSLLARAQAALDDLRYEEAAELADRAWRAGGNRRDELIAIFRLAGQVAVTMGNGALAESHFERLLALDPEAQLPDGISPKIAARFAAARARTTSRLKVSFRTEGTRVSAEVASDPAKMVAGLRARYGKEGDDLAVAPAPLSIDLKVDRSTEVTLTLVDEYANVLAEERVTVGSSSAPTRTQAQVGQSLAERNASAGQPAEPRPVLDEEEDDDDQPRTVAAPVYTRWEVWAGAAGAAGAVGIVFGLKARSDQSELDDLNADSGGHDFRDAQAVEDSLHRDALVANVCFVLAAGAGTAALLLWLRERRSRSSPTVAPSGAGGMVRFDF